MRGNSSLIGVPGVHRLTAASRRALLIVLASATLDSCTKKTFDGRGSIPESQTAHQLVSDLRQQFGDARATYLQRTQAAAASGRTRAALDVPAHQANLGRTSPAREDGILPAGVPTGFVREAGLIRPVLPAGAGLRRLASLALPERGSGAFRLSDEQSSLSVSAAVSGATEAPAEVADGYVVYHGALGPGVDLLHRATIDGTEDYFSFAHAPEKAEVRYNISLEAGVAGLRLVPGSNTLEFLDAGGVPRIRIAPPWVLGADGVKHDATLSLSGCAADVRASAPFGRAVTAPGSASCAITVAWNSAAVQYPAIVDPAWSTTSSSPTPRYGAWAASLLDGRILVAGGDNATGGLASADLYDPATSTWSATGSMNVPRSNYISQAVVLKDGRVLVASGCCDLDSGPAATGTAELYDPATGQWTFTGNPNVRRTFAQLVPLKDGRVLAVAGLLPDGATFADAAEIYDPAKGIWTLTGKMTVPRYGPAVARMGDGRVLVAGGQNEVSALDSAELFNPATGTWSAVAPLPAGPTTGPSAIAMQDGRVLVVGGSLSVPQTFGAYSWMTPTAGFVFDGTGWTSTGPFTVPRDSGAILANLRSGRVLLVGGSENRALANGSSDEFGAVSVAERLDVGTLEWVRVDDAPFSSFNGTGARLLDGSVLITGGYSYRCTNGGMSCVDNGYLADAAIMAPDVKPQGAQCGNAFECGTGQCVDGVCCENACGACGVCSVAKGGTKDGLCTPVVIGSTKSVCSGYLCDGQATSCPASCSASSSCVAADYCDPSSKCVLDDQPPAMTLPASITAEATGIAGATVTWTATANDNADGARPVTCAPASGATFAFGKTTVACTSRDTRGNVANASFGVTVIDSTPPTLSTPAAISAEATGADGAVVTFAATASDLVDGTLTPGCLPASGSVFAIGDTSVACSVTDSHGNTAAASFTISVKDQTPPALALSGDLTLEATGPAGAAASFAATAFDVVDGATAVSCAPASGASFPLGSSPVTCSATDAHGNKSTGGFTVTVRDTTPPRLTVPGPISVAATGAAGATVSYASTASDLVDGAVVPVCAPASGSTFALGTTAVSCSASDGHGNVALGSFNVTVFDVTPPSAALDPTPAYTNQASLPVTGVASDDVKLASVMLVVNGVPGSALAVDAAGRFSAQAALLEGRNTLVVRATDSSGNVAGSTPSDVVLDSQAPALTVSAPVANKAYGSSTVEVRAQVTDATPTTVTANGTALTVDPATQSAQGTVTLAGTGPFAVDVAATDAAGNTSSLHVPVLIDLRAPVLTTSLVDSTIGRVPGNVLAAQFGVQDQAATTVSYSFGATSSFPRGGGSETQAVPLVEGVNAVTMSASNEVGFSSTLSRTITYDTTAPVGSFVIPAPSTWSRGVVELTVDASDATSGVASVSFSVDQAAPLPGLPVTDGYMAQFDTRSVSDGSHGVHATLTDAAGNAGALDATLAVDNTAPSASLTSPANGSTVKGTISITVTGTDATSGVASIEVRVEGKSIGSCPSSPCTLSYDTTKLADGPFLVEAVATDRAGNTATGKGTLSAKNSKRHKFLISPIEGQTASQSVTVATAIDDPEFAQVECFVGNSSLGKSSNPRFTQAAALSKELDGPLLVQCGAADRSGSVAIDSATVLVKRWTIELEPGVLNLRSSGKGTVGFEVVGPSARNLVPLAQASGLTLVLPGAAALAVTYKSSELGSTSDQVHLRVDRNAAIAALRTGLSVGAIDLRKPVLVKLVGQGKVIGTVSVFGRRSCWNGNGQCE